MAEAVPIALEAVLAAVSDISFDLHFFVNYSPMVVFKKKCSKSVTLGVEIQAMNTRMKPMQFICENIVFFSEFSKFISHMFHIFVRKLIKVSFSAIFQYEQCHNTLIIENSQIMNRSCIVAYTT